MISIIVLTYNEEACITDLLNQLSLLPSKGGSEILLADGGSTDQTIALAEGRATIVHAPKGKARQMNAAAKMAQGDILFFVHADMTLAENSLLAIEQQIEEEGYDGGGFANVFDRHNDKIKQLGTLLNLRFFNKKEQSDRGIFYGDNGIFVRKVVFDTLGGFKDLPIMEDYDFSIRLRATYQVKKIYAPPLVVSSRRHEKAGFIKTRLQWIFIKKLYLLGVPAKYLVLLYKDIR